MPNLDGGSAQAGVLLTLTAVYDTQASCAPLASVQLDVWHCNASGVYSDEAVENTANQTWLRGYQLTNGAGLATFSTIAGLGTRAAPRIFTRAPEVIPTPPREGTNTTQLFFPQAAIDALSTTVTPYSKRGVNPTTNARDGVYTRQTKGRTELVLAGSAAAGYATTVSLGLPITPAAR